MEIHQTFSALHHLAVTVHRKAEACQGRQGGAVRGGQVCVGRSPTLHIAHTISKKAQGPPRRDGRIQLAHGASGCIAGIDKRLLVALPRCDETALPFIEGLERVSTHVHLTANFEHGGPARRVTSQAQGNLVNGADVLGDIFTGLAVTARGRLYQETTLIAKADRQTVKLQLAAVRDRCRLRPQADFTSDPGIKVACPPRRGVGLRANAEHRHRVHHR